MNLPIIKSITLDLQDYTGCINYTSGDSIHFGFLQYAHYHGDTLKYVLVLNNIDVRQQGLMSTEAHLNRSVFWLDVLMLMEHYKDMAYKATHPYPWMIKSSKYIHLGVTKLDAFYPTVLINLFGMKISDNFTLSTKRDTESKTTVINEINLKHIQDHLKTLGRTLPWLDGEGVTIIKPVKKEAKNVHS